MRELQGAIIGAAAFQVFIGYSGLMGLLLRFISPVTIAPTIALVGLSLFSAGPRQPSCFEQLCVDVQSPGVDDPSPFADAAKCLLCN